MDTLNTPLTPKIYLRNIKIMHFGIVFGSSIFGIIVYYTGNSWNWEVDEGFDAVAIAVPIFAIISLIVAPLLFNHLVSKEKENPSLKAKLINYQTASIVKWALIEAAAMFSIVTAMLSNSLLYLCIGAFLIIYLITQRPTKKKIEKDLVLDYNLLHLMNQTDDVLI